MCVQLLNNAESLITTTNLGNLMIDSAYSGTQNIINAPLDWDNRKSFRVLHDRTYIVNPATGTTAAPVTTARSIRINLRPNRNVMYFHQGQTLTKNSIYWIWMSSSSATASQVIEGVLMTYYTDS